MDLNQLTSEKLAQLFNVNVRTIQLWTSKEGMPFIQENGRAFRYSWRLCFKWWIDHKYEAPAANHGSSEAETTQAQAAARLTLARARREEIRVDREEGRLVPVEQIEPAWLRVAETVKNRVLTLPPKAKEALPHLNTEDVKVLHRLCREALEELSHYRPPETKARNTGNKPSEG